jgi:RNA polymerase sigma-70 factor (ECF subfamily)
MGSDPAKTSACSEGRFAATRWTMVVAAGNWRESSHTRRAMEELLHVYWFPLYAYARRRGQSPTDAEDVVQGFFTYLLEHDAILTVSPSKGKFRSFLLASLNHYLSNERDKRKALRRGGDKQILSLDAASAEAKYASEPVDAMTPDRVFERRWALAVLEQSLAVLRAEYARKGKEKLFLALQHVLTGAAATRHAEVGRQLGMTEGAVRVAAHHLRRQFREIVREEIAQTVAQPEDVDEELQSLKDCL